MTTTVSYSNFRKDLKHYMRKVHEDCDTLLVTNKDPNDNVIVMSSDEYDSMMETVYLMQDPKYYSRLLESMAEARKGNVSHHDLIDPEAHS